MTKTRLNRKLLPLLCASLFAVSGAYAQDTTSGMTGRVVDEKGNPVAGAKVHIVHVPSGTTSLATTDANGRYQAQGLRVGGPYHVDAEGGGGKAEADNVFLNLAENSTVNLVEIAPAKELEGISVTANSAVLAVFNSDNKGLSTNISPAQLQAAPNGDNSFQSIARMDPRISVTDRDAQAISANGKNFRYNCITVDQVNAGDPFGLESNGLASVGSPISTEAIDSYQLSTTSFDSSTRGCVGANVNAVSKSGTNEFHGEFYYKYRSNDDNFMGKIAPIGSDTEQPYTGWDREWTAGFNVHGPIIKDTLFFFFSYEKAERVAIGAVSAPSDGTGSTTLVQGLDTAFFNAVNAQSVTYGLNPGDRSLANLTDERYLAKVDWNINDRQRAVFRYSETKENQPVPTGSSTSVTPNSNWYFKNRDIKTYLGQLFSDWTDVFSTEIDLQYADYGQTRGPLVGGAQPSVQVTVPTTAFTPSQTVGTEFSSQVNLVAIKSYYGYFAGAWHLGDHVVKAGFNGNEDKVYDAFEQAAYGSYTFQGLTNYQNAVWEEYVLKQPAPGLSLQESQADFKKQQYGLFLQDTWQATDRLSLTYGIRYDVPKFPEEPRFNPCFAAAPGVAFTARNENGSTLCTVAKGGFGFANNSVPSKGTYEPRVSFNYDFDTEYKTQLRGGIGMFVSDVPTVWYTNTFGNPGTSIVTYDIVNAGNDPNGTLLCSTNGRNFVKATGASCPAGQIPYVKQAPVFNANNPLVPGTGTLVLGSSVATMSVDTIDPKFQMPSTTQVALAFDRELPWMGIISSLSVNFTQTNDDIFYNNLNLGAPQFTGSDGRKYFCTAANAAKCSSSIKAGSNPSFGNVTLLTNTHQGQSNTVVLSFTKPMSDDWSAMVAFRGGHATDVNPGTSSVANSNILGNVWVNPNTDIAATSNYSVAERVIGSFTWQHHFFGDYLTQFSVFGDMHSGAPYSWVSGTDTNGDGYSRDLVYIPKSVTDVEWATAVTDAQKAQFMTYVDNNSYLKKHEGEIAQRNAVRAPWINQFDFAFRQEIPGIFEGNKGELRFDFFNIGNLFNSHWGVEQRAGFPLIRNLANVSGYNPVTGKYIYDISSGAYKDKNGNYVPQSLVINEGQTPGVPIPSQRWSVMITAKYKF